MPGPPRLLKRKGHFVPSTSFPDGLLVHVSTDRAGTKEETEVQRTLDPIWTRLLGYQESNKGFGHGGPWTAFVCPSSERRQKYKESLAEPRGSASKHQVL